jgi:hypothetical protein
MNMKKMDFMCMQFKCCSMMHHGQESLLLFVIHIVIIKPQVSSFLSPFNYLYKLHIYI